MRLNNKGQGQLMMILLIVGLVFGGLGGLKLASLNPFKTKTGIVQKDEGYKTESYRDKTKGIEWRSEERYKMQNKGAVAGNSIGSKIGSFIDSSIQMIIYIVIIGLALLFFTGINIFKKFKEIASNANRYRKALKQTVKAIDVAGPKMSGKIKVLKEWLSRKQDESTENLIRELKNE